MNNEKYKTEKIIRQGRTLSQSYIESVIQEARQTLSEEKKTLRNNILYSR